MYNEMANSHPTLKRGQVWCHECGNTEKVKVAICLQHGWPTCCGYTMSLDSPEEHASYETNSNTSNKD